MAKFRDSIAGSIVILGLICLVVTAALAGTYAATYDTIEAAKAAEITKALSIVLPGVDNFTPIEGSYPNGVEAVYAADNGTGHVVNVVVKGYGGPVSFVVGLDPQLNYTGVEVTKHEETQGIGTKAVHPDYLVNFVGLASPSGVDAIAGATVTSGTVQKALDLASKSVAIATGVAPVEVDDSANYTPIDTLPEGTTAAYQAVDGSGYRFEISTSGYGGEIPFVIDMDPTGNFTQITLKDHEETVGIGTKVEEPDYLAEYYGQSDPKGVDVIGGATVTSKALQKALGIAVDAFTTVTGAPPSGVSTKAPEPEKPAATQNPDGSYSYTTTVKGYGGEITFTVIIDKEGNFTEISHSGHSETAGIGDAALEDAYLSQFYGISDQTTVDSIAGATVSSKAVKKALREAGEAYGVATGTTPPETPAATTDALVFTPKADGSGFETVVSVKGYGGKFPLTVFLDKDGNITDVQPGAHSETPGIGDKALMPQYLEQFANQQDPMAVDTIAGVTVTSKGIRNALVEVQTAFATKDGAPTATAGSGEVPEGALLLDFVLPEGVVNALLLGDHNYLFHVTTDGYGGAMDFSVIIDPTGNFVDVQVAGNNETVGIGDKALAPEYLGQFHGLSDQTAVDSVAGATVTSKAVKKALRLSQESFLLAKEYTDLDNDGNIDSPAA